MRIELESINISFPRSDIRRLSADDRKKNLYGPVIDLTEGRSPHGIRFFIQCDTFFFFRNLAYCSFDVRYRFETKGLFGHDSQCIECDPEIQVYLPFTSNDRAKHQTSKSGETLADRWLVRFFSIRKNMKK